MGTASELGPYLEPGAFVDSDAGNVVEFARRVTGDETDAIAKAVRLYYAVRDGIAYTPYCDFRSSETFRASAVLAKGSGFCVGKAAVLAAAARAAGIPARVGFADVRNHLSTPRLRALMGSDVFYYHGYAELYLDGRWVKATPAFDRVLCDRFGVRPLEFDGQEDSLFHPYDRNGRRHMEYLRDRGPSVDVPVADIIATFESAYPGLASGAAVAPATQFRTEAEALMIRALTSADRQGALAVINEAARWYREFLPPGEYHEPEMTPEAWDAEARRMTWYGAFLGGTLLGVMALEYVRDVALLRHAYVLPGHQRQGVGSQLLDHLEAEVGGARQIVIGTYRDNYKARSALEKAGYRPSADPEAVLRAYYAIPEARLRASVTYEKLLGGPGRDKEALAMATEAKVGIVTGYYAKIGVAAVRLTDGPLAVGDTIRIHGHTTDLTQPVDSLQLDHRAVSRAEPGTEVALKVRERVRKHDQVSRVIES